MIYGNQNDGGRWTPNTTGTRPAAERKRILAWTIVGVIAALVIIAALGGAVASYKQNQEAQQSAQMAEDEMEFLDSLSPRDRYYEEVREGFVSWRQAMNYGDESCELLDTYYVEELFERIVMNPSPANPSVQGTTSDDRASAFLSAAINLCPDHTTEVVDYYLRNTGFR